MAYDADCGPCTRFRQAVDVFDRFHQIDFLSLTDADKQGLLDGIPPTLRFRSFHLIAPNGAILSGAEALLPLIDLFPLGSLISKIIILVPGGRRMTKFIYSKFSKLRDSGSCALSAKNHVEK